MEVIIESSSETLLEQFEKRKIPVATECRNGYCGFCRTEIVSGEVEYIQQPLAYLKPNEVLICCSTAKTNVTLNLAHT
ncbi:MAG: 2Fe-2S iron-sulfur cluster binding domain-containing protein [Pseudomonadaceae bacterium]|nr:2Fe-2S iron-sulfur cluster binding domain-containing protein [Pseudomonadaceae bacterium]